MNKKVIDSNIGVPFTLDSCFLKWNLVLYCSTLLFHIMHKSKNCCIYFKVISFFALIRRGQPIRDRRRTKFMNNGSLLIEDVEDDDAGNYTCRVQNVYGADEIAFMLVVRGMFMVL